MKTEAVRAERARELAEWFRGIAGGAEASDLMARTAGALERLAAADDGADGENEFDENFETYRGAKDAFALPDMPIAANDNAIAARGRRRA